jgi:integrase
MIRHLDHPTDLRCADLLQLVFILITLSPHPEHLSSDALKTSGAVLRSRSARHDPTAHSQSPPAEAFRSQILLSGSGPWLFPSDINPKGYQQSFRKVWATTLRKAGVAYFRLYDLRSTYASRLSSGGVC